MSKIYEYVRHPRAHELATRTPVKTADVRGVDHDNRMVRFNARFGLGITLVVGTMWCAYLFTGLALISLPSAIKSHDAIIIIAWIAQTFLQLVLLSIIIVGQNIQAAGSDARAKATYDDAAAVLEEAKQIQIHLQAQDDKIIAILNRIEELAAR